MKKIVKKALSLFTASLMVFVLAVVAISVQSASRAQAGGVSVLDLDSFNFATDVTTSTALSSGSEYTYDATNKIFKYCGSEDLTLLGTLSNSLTIEQYVQDVSTSTCDYTLTNAKPNAMVYVGADIDSVSSSEFKINNSSTLTLSNMSGASQTVLNVFGKVEIGSGSEIVAEIVSLFDVQSMDPNMDKAVLDVKGKLSVEFGLMIPENTVVNIKNGGTLNYTGSGTMMIVDEEHSDGNTKGGDFNYEATATVPSTIDVHGFHGNINGVRQNSGIVNTKRGACNAPGLVAQPPNATTDNNLDANQVVSTGAPDADAVYCDIDVNLDVLETISLKVNANDVTIKTPVKGSPNWNFGESGSDTEALVATVDTNSLDGYQLLIKGVSENSSNASCVTKTLLCSLTGAAVIATNSFTTPDSDSHAAAWGYRAHNGKIEPLDSYCVGRVITTTPGTTPISVTADTEAKCTLTGGATIEDSATQDEKDAAAAASPVETITAVTPGVWTPRAGDGANASIEQFCTNPVFTDEASCTASGTESWKTPFPAAVAGTTKFNKIPTADELFMASSTTVNPDSNIVCSDPTTDGDATTCGGTAQFSHPVVSAKTYIRFGAMVSAATPAGKYKGTVRLTAVPKL